MSHRSVRCGVLLVLICLTCLATPASAQHFKQLKGTLNSVVAGRNEVFGLDNSLAVWRFNSAKGNFDKITGASSFFQVAVGGGSRLQSDDVWGLDIHDNVYRFDYSTATFKKLSGIALTQIAVGEGVQDSCHAYEVWGVNSSQQVFRYNYCTSTFDQMTGQMVQVATGAGNVWALDTSGKSYYFYFGGNSFGEVCCGVSVQSIAVGVNDVWAVSNGAIYRYNPFTTGFVEMYGTQSALVFAGADGVWAFEYPSNEALRFEPVTGEFVVVSELPVPNIVSMAVGSGAGVFAVGSNGHVFAFVRP